MVSEYILLFQQRKGQSAILQVRTRTSGVSHSFYHAETSKSVAELTNLRGIDGSIPDLKRCCADDELPIPMIHAEFLLYSSKSAIFDFVGE